MKKFRAVLTIALALIFIVGCSSQRTSDEPAPTNTANSINSGIFDAQEVVKQYRKAINQDDTDMAKSFFSDTIIVGNFDATETVVYTKAEMDEIVQGYSNKQQEYNKDEYDVGDYWVIVEAYEPNYIMTMVWGVDREKYKIRTKYVVKNDLITEIYTEENKELNGIIAKNTEGAVGIECEIKDDKIIVSAVREDYSAEKVGIKVGDEITYINKIPTEDMRLIAGEHLYRLRGEIDTSVDITILRNGKKIEFTLKRSA